MEPLANMLDREADEGTLLRGTIQDEVGYAVFRFMRSAMSQIKAEQGGAAGARGRQAERRMRHVASS